MQNIIEFMNKYFTYLIAIISGLVGVFAFSPFDYWPLAYVSLLGLLAAYLALYPMLFTYLVQRFQVQSAVIFAQQSVYLNIAH